ALKSERVAAFFTRHHCAPMRTSIAECSIFALAITVENQRAASDFAGQIIVGLLKFGPVSNKQPTAIEDQGALKLQNLRARKHVSRSLEQASLPFVLNPTTCFPCRYQC